MSKRNKKLKNILILFLFITAGVVLVYNERVKELAQKGISRTAERLFSKDTTIPYEKSLRKKLADIGWQRGSEVFIRIFKQEDKLELFGNHQGQWQLLKTYDICRWSGKLGPKFAEGDRQAPEGFYMISKKQLNPFSRHHLSFNLGFPNQVERAQGKTGSFLMVHGGCSSIGCYAITDPAVEEVYSLVEAAFKGGKSNVAVHAFPFRLDDDKLQKYKTHAAYNFWKTLKPGFDRFEAEMSVPKVYACNDQYGYTGKDGAAPKGCTALKAW